MRNSSVEKLDQVTRFPRIAHVIADLNGFGGTETTLLRYLTRSHIPRDHHRVIVLKTTGIDKTLGAQMVRSGISVVALEQGGALTSMLCIGRLLRELRDYKPDVVSAWLYFPSLLATVLAPFLMQRVTLVWHIRSMPFARAFGKPGRFLLQRILALLSRLVRPKLVSNSGEAMRAHMKIGYSRAVARWVVVPNGIDTEGYVPCYSDRHTVRSEIGVPSDALLVGCVGRFAQEKGYSVMLNALSIAIQELDAPTAARVHFLAAGNGVTTGNIRFMRLLERSGFPQSRIHLLEKRADVPRLLRALDVFVLPSISESFPNALAEAMATGLACVATDVGMCADVMGTRDFIVPPGDEQQLGRQIASALTLDERKRTAIGDLNRRRIVTNFALDRMVGQFDALFTADMT